MPINVLCGCGKRTTAKDEYAGKRAKCPGCGAVITIEAEAALDEPPPPRTHFQAVTLDIGQVVTRESFAKISIKIDDRGDGMVLLYATEMGTRRNGEMLPFALEAFRDFAELVRKTEAAITQMQRTGQVRKQLG